MSASGVAALNVYKKVAIIRRSTDVLSYEDADGTVKTISDLHLAAAATTPHHTAKPKNDIPVPKIRNVETYQTDIPPNYNCPLAYVRHQKLSQEELKHTLEYVVDAEDEVWLRNNLKFGELATRQQQQHHHPHHHHPPAQAPKRSLDGTPKLQNNNTNHSTVPLPLDYMETMLDLMEKATGFDAIITTDRAEYLIVKKLPQLYHMYPLKGRAGVVTLKHVLQDVYNYWMSKRSKLKRPLLRRFWPVTSTEDTNPHLVFRPREKEKYKLRRKRQNDMDGHRKLLQLKQDFEQVKAILELVKRREELNQAVLWMQREWFQQQLYNALDTSGTPRESEHVSLPQLQALLAVPRHFEATGAWNRAKRDRDAGSSGLSSSGGSSPVPLSVPTGDRGGPSSSMGRRSDGPPRVVAGQNGGEPAPHFLHPLHTREMYATSWDRAQPFVPAYVDAHPVPTFRFRHRPRVGRGGRICIDRVPLPIHPEFEPPTVLQAGHAQLFPNPPKARLLDLLPKPLDHDLVSRRIEAICLSSLKDDYDAQAPAGATSGADQEENDGHAVVVKMNDWLSTDDQVWGEERYSVGPI